MNHEKLKKAFLQGGEREAAGMSLRSLESVAAGRVEIHRLVAS
ncbi:hypothetical protein HNR46_000899 [Haloferula luteola]|uniref:Uncharacterized protein n=1 Tax=Haloferula luteola TaxID=595692 RepID=A0A840VCU2_9BACT|nr:hypothetical protein [Haloferula luteola]MBB5350671.1 hypothetical protein [Haloferula luteola]